MNSSALKKKLPEIFLLVWLLALVFSYLIYQLGNNTPPTAITALITTMRSLLTVGLTFTAAAGLGIMFTKNFIESETLRMFCAPLIGLIIFSTILLFFGLLHLIPTSLVLWLVLGGLNLLFWKTIRTWLNSLKNQAALLFPQKRSAFLRLLQIGVLVLFVLALLIALAPPTQWDSLMYHLSAGKYYLDEGGIITSTDNNRYSNPNFMILIFMGLQIAAGPSTAAVLMWLLGVWAMFGFSIFFQQQAPDSSQNPLKTWMAAALTISANGIWLALTRAYSDMALLPYLMGAVYLLFEWRKNVNKALVVIAGLLCGVLVSTKYTAIPFCIGLGFLTIYLTWQRNKKLDLKPFLILTAAALLVFLPWMVKNWVLDGNPISPYVWGAPSFDAYDRSHTQPTAAGNPFVNLILLPLQASVYGYEYLDPFQGSIGPVLLGFFPLIFLSWKKVSEKNRQTLLALIITICPAYLMWTIGAGISQNLAIVRFYYPMFAVIAIIIVLRWESFSPEDTSFPWQRILQILIAMMLLIGLLQGTTTTARQNPLPVVVGMQSEFSYLSANLGNFYTLSELVNEISASEPDTRVLMLWEPRAFYCQPNCVGDDNLNTWQKEFDQQGSVGGVLREWQAAGVTHVFINHNGAEFLLQQSYDRIPPLTNYNELLSLIPVALVPVQVFDDYGLYQLSQ